MDYIDSTTAIDPIVKWEQISPIDPNKVSSLLTSSGTNLKSNLESFDLFRNGTGINAPTSHISSEQSSLKSSFIQTKQAPSSTSTKPSVSKANPEEIDVISTQRVKLMAMKYESGKVSKEIIARLEILNGRLSERFPRISEAQVAALEITSSEVMSIKKAREERAKRLGLNT